MNERAKRVGIAILRVLTERALESIPIYGPYLKIGYEVINAVRDEVSNDMNQRLSPSDMVTALHSLNYLEALHTVDSVLKSRRGAKSIRKLTHDQREKLRWSLVNLTSDFDLILADIQRSELYKKREQGDREWAERELTRQRLEKILEAQLRGREYRQASETVARLLLVTPGDPRLMKVQAFIDERLTRPVDRVVLGFRRVRYRISGYFHRK